MRLPSLSLGTDSGFVYILKPPWAKVVDAVIRAFIYMSLTAFGIAQVFVEPLVIYNFSTTLLMRIAGAVVILFAILSFCGTVTRNLRLEYGSIWFLVGGFVPYMISMWVLVLQNGTGYLASALSWTALALYVVHRAFRCTVAARTALVLRRKELDTLKRSRRH